MSCGAMLASALDPQSHPSGNGVHKQIDRKPLRIRDLSPATSPSWKPRTSMTGHDMPSNYTTSSGHSPLHALSINSSKNQSMSTLTGSEHELSSTWGSNPSPLTLPQAATPDFSSSNPFNTTTGDAQSRSKAPGLIRRISRGAHNRLRRRASTTQANRIRDQSAGPVLVRRRSDSTGASDIAGDVSELELETPSEDNLEDNTLTLVPSEPVNALGITSAGRRNTAISAFEGGIAPTISAVLEQGTYLTKVTRKKRKTLKFRLDTSAAKVVWNDKNPAKQFYIDDVREIRVGAEARTSRQDIQIPPDMENCWMTIVYDVPEGSKGRTIKTMHLVATNEYIVKLWTDALKNVERERIEIMNALSSNVEKSQRSMQMAWKQAMARKRPDSERKIDFEDARWICIKLEINCSSATIRSHFNQADRDMMGMLNYPQYEAFINLFKIRKDIKAIYESIRPATELELDQASFLDFLREQQGVDVDRDRRYWENKFEHYSRGHSTRGLETHPCSAAPLSMNLHSFQIFMASGSNSALHGTSEEVSLDRPFNEYFISSSHNTYLLGRQVAGESSVEGYISALVKGCRCIEVDCWDGRDGRPVVNHGRTLSTEVLFEDCISVISKYAFTSSPYPLIVSLEVHCGPEQQAAMVDIMIRHFGEALLTAALHTNATSLPSPEELRNRILIKVKATHQRNDGQAISDALNNATGRSRSHSSSFVRGSFDHPVQHTPTWPLSPPTFNGMESPTHRFPNGRAASTASSINGTAVASSSGSESDIATPSLDSKKKRKTSNIIPALSVLGVYACGIKYSDFNVPEAREYNHIYSFAENTFSNVSKETESKHQLEKHNIRYLMRVYPAARRIDSSNFNPLQVWRRGVQMAALNWQTYDVHLQINEAMFAAGIDRLGYVLKPEELRHPKHLLASTMNEHQLMKERKGMKFVKFSVELVSAQRLPRPRDRNSELGMNPYIEFEMFSAEDRGRSVARSEGGVDASARDGSSGIGTPVRRRTKIVEGNGFDPTWKENISMTVETKYPELIFVRWTVWNSSDGRSSNNNNTMLATFTAKLSSLQQGYRHLPLFNAYGERYRDAKLFVKIKKDLPIPLNHSIHIEEEETPANGPTSIARVDSVKTDRAWTRKLFSRTPSQRKKSRDPSPSFSRTSSMEKT